MVETFCLWEWRVSPSKKDENIIIKDVWVSKTIKVCLYLSSAKGFKLQVSTRNWTQLRWPSEAAKWRAGNKNRWILIPFELVYLESKYQQLGRSPATLGLNISPFGKSKMESWDIFNPSKQQLNWSPYEIQSWTFSKRHTALLIIILGFRIPFVQEEYQHL